MTDQILYIGSTITDESGNVLLLSNCIYTIEEPWDFSDSNPLTQDSLWFFFIYDESKSLYPRGYELRISDIKHPRNKIIQDIIDS